MSDFFRFSDAQWARIEPLLPTDVCGKARVDDRRVLSGIVHALRCGGRWADCADVYGPKKTLYNRFVRWSERGDGKTSSAPWPVPRRRLTGCSSTASASRSIAAPAAEKGGPWLMVSASPRAVGTPNSTRSATRRGAPSSCSSRRETSTIAKSPSSASRPCHRPPSWSPTRAMT